MSSLTFHEAVDTRYTVYNSLFLNLPFDHVYHTGTLLPLFEQYCRRGYAVGQTPREIVEHFMKDFLSGQEGAAPLDLLFDFIKYVERQVVLFDSVEDAAYEQINDLQGKGSLRSVFERCVADGKTEFLRRRLETFRLRVVLTAHPTQFYPGQVLAIITDLEAAIRAGNLGHIDQLLQQLGKTAFINREKPSPYDEALSLCWFLENVFYRAVPEVFQRILSFLKIPVPEWTNDELITIGFWPGGDRDGNPFVTHDITLKVAARLRETVFRCYYRDIRILRRRLTFKGVEPLIQAIEQRIYQNAYGDPSEGYIQAGDLVDALLEVRRELQERHEGLFLDLLDGFLIKVRIFGFHLSSLDIRQDSRKHLALLRRLTDREDFAWSGDPDEELAQMQALLRADLLEREAELAGSFEGEMIETFRCIRQIQAGSGEIACHRYVISNAGCAGDVLTVFALACRLVAPEDGHPPLDIIPLFESIEDLAAAPHVMERLYRLPAYREHLERRDKRQTIMLGFSDGTKDGGYLQANFSIYKAKEALTEISRKYGITVLFFDGRGGPPARGGGNTHDFYASLGNGIETEEIQLTVQGQTISSNFGKPVSCLYNLEQLISAALENDLFPNRFRSLTPAEKSLMEELADLSLQAYMQLKSDPAFVPYLEHATPLRFFGDTNIGSRPVKRNSDTSLRFEDLRAIPFVGSWAQMKQNVPGYFGLGAAIDTLAQAGRLAEVKDLYRDSLFFKALIGNSMQSLAKSGFKATSYLADDPEFGAFWKRLETEYQLSASRLLEISGQRELLEDNTLSRESIRVRERIVLPLITIQQFALQSLRQGTDLPVELLEKLAMRCMFGIINAARNAA